CRWGCFWSREPMGCGRSPAASPRAAASLRSSRSSPAPPAATPRPLPPRRECRAAAIWPPPWPRRSPAGSTPPPPGGRHRCCSCSRPRPPLRSRDCWPPAEPVASAAGEPAPARSSTQTIRFRARDRIPGTEAPRRPTLSVGRLAAGCWVRSVLGVVGLFGLSLGGLDGCLRSRGLVLGLGLGHRGLRDLGCGGLTRGRGGTDGPGMGRTVVRQRGRPVIVDRRRLLPDVVADSGGRSDDQRPHERCLAATGLASGILLDLLPGAGECLAGLLHGLLVAGETDGEIVDEL